jgi:hypothetical protein
MTYIDATEWPPHLEALVAAPANHRLLHEDDEVRVLEVTVEPGERENLHHYRWPSITYRSGCATRARLPRRSPCGSGRPRGWWSRKSHARTLHPTSLHTSNGPRACLRRSGRRFGLRPHGDTGRGGNRLLRGSVGGFRPPRLSLLGRPLPFGSLLKGSARGASHGLCYILPF